MTIKNIDIKRGDTVHDGESWSWDEDGYQFIAQIRRDDQASMDDFEDGCCYDQNDKNLQRRALNRAIKNAYDRNEWDYYGVTVAVRRCGVLLGEDSLWGVEGNFTYKKMDTPINNTHFIEMIEEVADMAKHTARTKLFELQASLLNVSPPAKIPLGNASETPGQ